MTMLTRFTVLLTLLCCCMQGAYGASTVNTYSQEYCYTKLTTTKTASVPTATLAFTFPFHKTITTTSTPSTTVTPSTSTVISTVTVVTTSTTTITPAALTVAASAGFTPFASQLAADGYSFSEKRKRHWSELDDGTEDSNPLAARNAATTTCKISVSGGQVVISPTQYPKSAGCLKLAEVVTTTFVTKTASSTITITASTPVTTSVTTTTVTIIATSVAPAPSPFYAACAANNQVTHIAGNSVDGIQLAYGGPESGFSIGGGGSAYDCCVRCITYPFAPCVGYVYLFAPADYCYFATENSGFWSMPNVEGTQKPPAARQLYTSYKRRQFYSLRYTSLSHTMYQRDVRSHEQSDANATLSPAARVRPSAMEMLRSRYPKRLTNPPRLRHNLIRQYNASNPNPNRTSLWCPILNPLLRHRRQVCGEASHISPWRPGTSQISAVFGDGNEDELAPLFAATHPSTARTLGRASAAELPESGNRPSIKELRASRDSPRQHDVYRSGKQKAGR
ncbi:hypothetical protein LTR59_016148 [Friedmanniomyces endolithicus]|nr:hypothetical protein LTR59_016148 [Friedmanniomyces endolithicus]KAK0775293.1 hypothetical protein LTR75_016620 [Friedmanniomyces endolithicus]KAK0796488.1 hypothetical protein LTR38_008537 [Friedmanniomyces endolithicus]KAK0828029.1 hypothetical protein LTR03_016658 [Friedmanniomyces endolithicus]KAK0954138.1 hypothetical protein LTS01_024064 [Friedmanniomyces endolithicus]